MNSWRRAVLRGVTLALLGSVGLLWALSKDKTWVGWSVACAALGSYAAYRIYGAVRARGLRRERSWEAAIYDPSKREGAIEEVRRARDRLGTRRPRDRARAAQLSVLLAELLDAEERYDEAIGAVSDVAVNRLSPLDGGLVRHTQAVTHLRGGDPAGARAALRGRPRSGDRELDERLALLDAYAGLELGEAEDALGTALRIAGEAGVEPSVATEARLVQAAALDALGRRSEALALLAELDEETRRALSQLGLPRVRQLLAASARPGGEA